MNQSLFQRLFQRTKSKQEEDMLTNSTGQINNLKTNDRAERHDLKSRFFRREEKRGK